MKKIILLQVVLFFLISTGYSQRFIGQGIAGINVSQVDGDEVFGYHKVGFNGGASVMLPLEKKQRFFITIELLYSEQGAYRKTPGDTMIYTGKTPIDEKFAYNPKIKYKLTLDYVQVPVVFHFEDKTTGVAFGAGLAWGRLVRAQEIESGYRLITNVRSGIYSRNEWSVLGDIKIPIYKGLKFNFRFHYSFVPIRKRDFTDKETGKQWTRNQNHNILTFRVIYEFNGKYSLNMKMKSDGTRNGAKWVREDLYQQKY